MDWRVDFLPCKAKIRRHPDGWQGFLTQSGRIIRRQDMRGEILNRLLNKLWQSVKETDRIFKRQMSRRCPAWAYKRNESGNEQLQIGWSNSSKKKVAANMCSSSEVDPISIFVAGSFNHYGHRDKLREVIHVRRAKIS